MWLKLELEGITLQFQIHNYKKVAKEDWDAVWCRTDLKLQAGDWLNLRSLNTENLLASEVDSLRDSIEDLLCDRLSQINEIRFIEPDLVFALYPRKNKRDDPNVIYVKPGSEIIDVNMDFIVNLYDEERALTGNMIGLAFDRSDLEKVLTYLKLVTQDIEISDGEVQKLIADGTLHM